MFGCVNDFHRALHKACASCHVYSRQLPLRNDGVHELTCNCPYVSNFSNCESARFSQPIIGFAKSIDDRLHNLLKISSNRRWDEGVISAITPLALGIYIAQNLPNVDVVLYHRHCDISANDF